MILQLILDFAAPWGAHGLTGNSEVRDLLSDTIWKKNNYLGMLC